MIPLLGLQGYFCAIAPGPRLDDVKDIPVLEGIMTLDLDDLDKLLDEAWDLVEGESSPQPQPEP
jgi:hypothetical protein